jgi:hypothetical protein
MQAELLRYEIGEVRNFPSVQKKDEEEVNKRPMHQTF